MSIFTVMLQLFNSAWHTKSLYKLFLIKYKMSKRMNDNGMSIHGRPRKSINCQAYMAV